MVKITKIDWDVEDRVIYNALPQTIIIDMDEEGLESFEEIGDFISDNYGFTFNSYSYEEY